MNEAKSFLGKGFSFPPKVDTSTGRFVMVENEEDIKQSICIIIQTNLKERAMLPKFGCNMQQYIYELPDSSFEYTICNTVETALVQWESRIRNITVTLDKKELRNGIVYFNINYYVRATNNPNNLVFPYYLEEGIGD